ncbi:MAG: (d)CMP kinase [Crocinitomicaceae bacterium]|nr:(d)CMP kinase [Crocinitomicaceae bacterium]
MQKKITIAIDGHSSCGKSTLAKALAQKINYLFIDSGAMYRGVTLFCMRKHLIEKGIPSVEEIINHLDQITLTFQYNPQTDKADLFLNNENVEEFIRMPDVAANVSKVAAIKEVRKKLVEEQQKMGQNGGIIMDGRDIGSVVFPNAALKLFVTASNEIRAERRFKELREKKIETSYQEVYDNLVQRDELDSTRAESPLIQTEDAIVIDTTYLNKEEQLNLVYALYQKVI